jgi:hypothetical protein
MINVSRNYIEKATAPGRNVRCKIIADDVTYTDVDILSFEFNDVVHPEDMSFGTTCANRFQFELWSRRNIPLSTVIRPFISFADDSNGDGQGAEQCSLGEFHIARRYRRRNKYSVTCYDKMYRLDSQFASSLTFPCFAPALLAEIGKQFDFEVGFVPRNDVIESIPRLATYREIIGYIAGINGGFAKFSRDGILELKKLAVCNFALNKCQYTELSLKADMMEVRAVEFVTDSNIYSEGKGTKLTTYRQHNPFANQEITRRVFNEWKDFEYHGLTLKMRGLPFLESGDAVWVQDDIENKHYLALISDYTLLYNGTLNARLVSKSKNPIDDYDEPMAQQRMLEAMIEDLKIKYFNHVNPEHIWVLGTSSPVASINFNLMTNMFVVLNAQFTITANAETAIVIEYHINGIKVGQEPIQSLYRSRPQTIGLYYNFENVRAGRSTLTITARMSAGEAWIAKGELIASVSGQYMLGDNGPQRPEINLSQNIHRLELNDINLGLRRLHDTELKEPVRLLPHNMTIQVRTEPMSLITRIVRLRGFSVTLMTDSLLDEIIKIAANRLLLVFTNAVTFTGADLDLQGFAVTFGLEDLSIFSAEISGHEIILVTDDLSAFNEIVIKYDRAVGNLLGAASRNPVDSFNYILNMEEA